MAFASRKMFTSVYIFLVCVFHFGACNDDYFKEVPKELRCSGCELTVKVLDQMLGNSKPKDAIKLVDLAYKVMCDEKRFTISEYKADNMVKTCKFMKEFHGEELKQELIKHYSHPKSTYMELSQQVCLNIMRLCPGIAHRMPDNDESVEHLKHYLKVSGHDAKIAKPVAASRDEL